MAHLECQCRADGCRQAATYDRVRAHRPALDVVEVHRAAIAVRAPLDLPYSSAITSFGGVPFAITCPCARCVDAITSLSPSARQTPTAIASWPMQACRKPASSPARNRSITFSSKRRINSISPRNWSSRSRGRGGRGRHLRRSPDDRSRLDSPSPGVSRRRRATAIGHRPHMRAAAPRSEHLRSPAARVARTGADCVCGAE